MENRELITKAIRYIQENTKENLALETIADKAGFSLAYFDTPVLRNPRLNRTQE